MLYPFMTLNDNTEIVHSEIIEKDGKEQVEARNKDIIELWYSTFKQITYYC